MRKKWIAGVVTAAALLGLWGCDNTPAAKVYVQNVGEITGMGAIGVQDAFPGIVVSESVTEIQRDSERTVSMLHVAEGDDVNQGDVLSSMIRRSFSSRWTSRTWSWSSCKMPLLPCSLKSRL